MRDSVLELQEQLQEHHAAVLSELRYPSPRNTEAILAFTKRIAPSSNRLIILEARIADEELTTRVKEFRAIAADAVNPWIPSAPPIEVDLMCASLEMAFRSAIARTQVLLQN
jgi:hypothetical protein